MSTHRNFDRVCIAVLILSLLLTALFMNGNALGLEGGRHTLGYEDRIFDTSRVHTLAIVIDDWEGFLETCENEEYAACSVVIDNESYKNVGLRAKGNTSLTTVRSMDSNRYSLKIEFDHYETGKTYHGLDKLCLNNIIQDNTYMKDYLTYQMMGAFGAAAPLCSYVWITVNGEDWGLYLAVEGVEDAFLQRNYGSGYGELYKPDSQSFGGGGPGRGRDFRMSDFMNQFDGDTDTDSETDGVTNTSGASGTDSDSNTNGVSATAAASGTNGASDTGDSVSWRRGGHANGGGFGGMPFPDGMGGGMPFPGDMGDGTGFPFPGAFADGEDPTGAFADGEDPTGAFADGEDPTGGFGDMPFPGFPDGTPFGDMAAEGDSGERRGFGGMRGMGSDDVKLKYTDDDTDSYSSIFGNAKTDVTQADKARLIASLKILGEMENPESVVDIDAVLRYFTVHNYVVNGDSYTGSMIHNYYLYEKDGRLSMIPWDYNLAFGGFQGGSASGSVNDPIDTPLSVAGDGDRPMADWFVQQNEYTELYHQYFREFLESVDASAILEAAYPLIAPYVERDPTKFCAYEDFEKGVEALRVFLALRTESVQGQLEGVIPSTDDGQSADSSALVDASALTISDMGNMGFGGRGGRNFNSRNTADTSSERTNTETFSAPSGTPALMASEATDAPAASVPSETGTPDDAPPSGTGTPDAAQSSRTNAAFPGMNGNFPGPGGDFGGGQTGASSLDRVSTETWILLGVSAAVLLAGLFIARRFRRF